MSAAEQQQQAKKPRLNHWQLQQQVKVAKMDDIPLLLIYYIFIDVTQETNFHSKLIPVNNSRRHDFSWMFVFFKRTEYARKLKAEWRQSQF